MFIVPGYMDVSPAQALAVENLDTFISFTQARSIQVKLKGHRLNINSHISFVEHFRIINTGHTGFMRLIFEV